MIVIPYFWLGLLAWSALVGASSYWKGFKNAENVASARHAVELATTIKRHRENAAIDMQAAYEHALKDQKAKIQYRDRIVRINETITQNPTACAVPAGYRMRINEAIDSITAPQPAKPDALRAVAETYGG